MQHAILWPVAPQELLDPDADEQLAGSRPGPARGTRAGLTLTLALALTLAQVDAEALRSCTKPQLEAFWAEYLQAGGPQRRKLSSQALAAHSTRQA